MYAYVICTSNNWYLQKQFRTSNVFRHSFPQSELQNSAQWKKRKSDKELKPVDKRDKLALAFLEPHIHFFERYSRDDEIQTRTHERHSSFLIFIHSRRSTFLIPRSCWELIEMARVLNFVAWPYIFGLLGSSSSWTGLVSPPPRQPFVSPIGRAV